MAKIKVEILKPVRLDGVDIPVGRVVEIDESLYPIWAQKELAQKTTGKEEKTEEPPKGTVKEDESKGDNAASSGTNKSGRGKTASKGRRKR